jgi:hypothetical protein
MEDSTKKDVNEILILIREKANGLKCQLCGNDEFAIMERKACLFYPEKNVPVISANRLPGKWYYAVTCKCCGNTLFFDEGAFE